MCFFYGLPITKDEIEKKVNRPFLKGLQYEPQEKINGFAHPFTPILVNDKTEIILAQWGLVPSWKSDKTFQKNTLNARIETLDTLPSFANYTQNRCLILASYFFEWRHEGKQKIPYKIFAQDSEILYMAGIYNDYLDVASNEITRTFSIVTTVANELMSYIHNHKKRMPIIIKEQDISLWLHQDTITSFAYPYESNLCGFEMH